MENPENQPSHFSADVQARLLLYTSAASLGALFTAQNVDAQVTASSALAPYPHELHKGAGTGYYYTYNYMDIDGDGKADFLLNVDNWRVDISGTPLTNLVLNPSTNAYLVSWMNGMVLDDTTGLIPTYKRFLANSAHGSPGTYLFNNFTNSSYLGFKFIGGADGLPHFGYVNLVVNGTPNTYGDFTVTVQGIYYNATPNAPITIGAVPGGGGTGLVVTNIVLGASNSVTIHFTSDDNAAASSFALVSSPTLGASAVWTVDASAVITSTGTNTYQAVTTHSGVAAFYRIRK